MTKRFVLAYEKGNEAIFEDRDYPYPKRMTNKQVERKLNELAEENEQLKSLLKDAEEEIETLKKSNQCSMEALANKISKRVAEEPEVKECSFCGEFRTEYHEEDCCGTWSAEDFCNAGHDLEDTDPNSCKDYWDNF